jgi:hypothetical protein
MGFMDKAKKLAEQAQQKLDEAQQSFNQGGSTQGQQQGGVRYDDHGRPVQDEAPAPEAPPAGQAPPPSAEPAPPAGAEPAAPAPEHGRPDSTPDPFRPLER